MPRCSVTFPFLGELMNNLMGFALICQFKVRHHNGSHQPLLIIKRNLSTHSYWFSFYLCFSLQSTRTPGLRPMVASDVKQVTALLQKYLSQFHLRPVMGEEEVKHWFFPQENIIDTYVVEVHFILLCPYAQVRLFCWQHYDVWEF